MRLLAVLPLVCVAGCSYGHFDERGNYFHSQAESDAYYQAHPTLEMRLARCVGQVVDVAMDEFGVPTSVAETPSGHMWEWHRIAGEKRSTRAVYFAGAAFGSGKSVIDQCRIWMSAGADRVVRSARHEGRCE